MKEMWISAWIYDNIKNKLESLKTWENVNILMKLI